MVTRSRPSPIALLLTLACAAVTATACTEVPLDYTRHTDGGSADGETEAGGPLEDAGPDTPADAPPDAPASDGPAATESGPPSPTAEAGSGPPCPCNSEATGQYCCIPGGAAAPFCTSDGASCTGASGIFVFCVSYDPETASQCCWNDSPSAGGAALYASSCGTRPVACTQPSDCVGQACNTKVCKGVTIGACGVEPACP
jgi:hypothetical protein